MPLSIPVTAFLVFGFLSFSAGKASPIIINNKTEYIIADGGDSEIHCEAQGDPQPSIGWEINGNFYDQMNWNVSENFNVSENASLVIGNPTSSEIYGLVNVTCIANNTAGTVWRTFRVVFMKAATITTSKNTYDVPDDGSSGINLNCAAKGYPSPVISWRTKGSILSEGRGVIYRENSTKSLNVTVFNNGSLRIFMTSQRNEGFGMNVTCIANNSAGDYDEKMYLVRFLKAPRILTNSSEITVIVNKVQFVFIPCETTGYPKPVVEWKFGDVTLNASHGSLSGNDVIHVIDGQIIRSMSAYQVFNNGTIRIDHPFTKFHVPHESFNCTARNIAGQDSRSHGFYIEQTATITTSKNTYDVPDDGSSGINLSCAAKGYPSPVISWRTKGSILSEGRGVIYRENSTKSLNVTVFNNGSLRIFMTSQRNEGFGMNVTCIANNSAGDYDEKMYLVRFLKAPRILTNSYEITVIVNKVQFVLIPCETTGYPKPVVEWKFGDVILTASHGSLPGNEVIQVIDDQNIRSMSAYQVFNNGTIRIDHPFTKFHVPHENFNCTARNIAGQDSRSHGFYIEQSIAYSFKVWFYKGLANLEDNIRAKLENSSKPLKLYSYNIISVNSTLGTANVMLVWALKDLKHYGDPVNVAALATDVEIALSGGNSTVEKLIVIAMPDPPVGLIVDDVTANEISFSWERPSKYFEINSYNILLNKGSGFVNAKQVLGDETSATLDGLDSDTKYLIKMESVNIIKGQGDSSKELEVKTKADIPVIIIVLVVVFVFLAILLLVLVIVYRRRRQVRKRRSIILGERNPYEESMPGVPFRNIYSRDNQTFCPAGTSDDPSAQNIFSWYEISRKCLTMGKILGEGEFGLVQKALWWDEKNNDEVPVAVKTIKDDATETDRKELFKELKLMADIEKHPNVVNLVGACSRGGPMWIAVEFCENGNLLNYLRNNRDTTAGDGSFSTSLEPRSRIKIAYEVSKGMCHLQEKKIIHRDLAARNILLGRNNIAKVSDFGLSRDIYERGLYEKRTGGKLPVKWMAIESLQDSSYNSKSDVWSFGVLFWEIETSAKVPYPGIAGTDLLGLLLNGVRLKQPTFTEISSEIYEIMQTCWLFDPNERPDFHELQDKLEAILMKLSDYLVDIFHEDNANALDSEADYVNYSVEESAETQTTPTNPA